MQRVTAHGLRGMCSTFAIDSGAASHAVAAMLGHGSISVTDRTSYIQRVRNLARQTCEMYMAQQVAGEAGASSQADAVADAASIAAAKETLNV